MPARWETLAATASAHELAKTVRLFDVQRSPHLSDGMRVQSVLPDHNRSVAASDYVLSVTLSGNEARSRATTCVAGAAW